MRTICLLLLASLLVASAGASADSWSEPTIQGRASKNGDHIVRIIPGKSTGDVLGFAGAATGPYAQAEWYRLKGGAYHRTGAVTLLNPVAPTQFHVSDSGALVTLDEWHNIGTGNVVVIYAPSGALIKRYRLSDLYSADTIKKFPTTVSSIHWRCAGSDYVSGAAVFGLSDARGGFLSFDLATGEFHNRPNAGLCTAR
ncbi:MAG: hypothetical protein V4723_22120 [Pseudomonadota bacterium]